MYGKGIKKKFDNKVPDYVKILFYIAKLILIIFSIIIFIKFYMDGLIDTKKKLPILEYIIAFSLIMFLFFSIYYVYSIYQKLFYKIFDPTINIFYIFYYIIIWYILFKFLIVFLKILFIFNYFLKYLFFSPINHKIVHTILGLYEQSQRLSRQSQDFKDK